MKFTVLLLRPADQREGHPSDWVYRAHVEAADAFDAVEAGLAQLESPPDDITPAPRKTSSVLAIYKGHLRDLFCS